MNKGKHAGQSMARAIIEFIHLMYQKNTATRVLDALIDELNKHRELFKR